VPPGNRPNDDDDYYYDDSPKDPEDDYGEYYEDDEDYDDPEDEIIDDDYVDIISGQGDIITGGIASHSQPADISVGQSIMDPHQPTFIQLENDILQNDEEPLSVPPTPISEEQPESIPMEALMSLMTNVPTLDTFDDIDSIIADGDQDDIFNQISNYDYE
jgi:hypothetical protein